MKDDDVERVALEIAGSLARAALSAMPPRDELLREALDALAYVIENRSCNHRIAENQAAVDFYAKACATCRARAAADKIRAGIKEGEENG